MKYRIVNIETGYAWYTDDDAEARRLSFENDKYDVEIVEDTTKYSR